MKKFLAILIASVMLCVGVNVAEAKITQLSRDVVLLSDYLLPPDGTTFETVVSTMVAKGNRNIQFLINTNGGATDDMFQVIDTMQAQREKGVKFSTVNIGNALSAGAFIWMMGDERVAIEGTLFMFHTAVWFHPLFGVMPWETVPEEARQGILEVNYKLRQMLLDKFRNTELVNELLGNGYGAENWFNVYLMDQRGLIDKIL